MGELNRGHILSGKKIKVTKERERERWEKRGGRERGRERARDGESEYERGAGPPTQMLAN